ncbi:hypothetical protein Vadar_014142 [Vaccinium darrowii]|uniref:Uncharacterized protein n=1 Tax=Vaccinium darrowii TaxID=229202 RepID=A0ACB7XAP2_9ERIC|nr:hypothetical protein Vadar_014142 [Vaccinium darrowii]
MTAWKSRDDPRLGEYSSKIDLNGSPQLFLYKGSDVLWRAGSWTGCGWTGVPDMTRNFIFNLNYVENQDGVYYSYSMRNASIFSMMVVNESGKLERLTWHENEHRWDLFYSVPKEQCNSYNLCGPNGNCDPSNAGMGLFDCSCLPGSSPSRQVTARAKVPNTWTARVNKSILALKEYELECLRNCTCNGYASADISHGDDGGGDDPINNTSDSLSFDSTGNLVITGPDQTNPVWSTNVSNPTLVKSSSAQLLDTGNLVLLDSNGVVVWQSFDHPTDTWLPYFRFGVDRKSGLNRFVTTWKSRDDPGLGEYSFKIDLNGSPQLFLYKGSDVVWRAGSWTGRAWSGIPEMTQNFIFSDNYVENQDEVYMSYSIRNASIFSMMVLNESGKLERLTWHDNEHQWDMWYSAPKEQCDSYNFCGPNGNCDPSNAGMGLFDCSCLPGFEPKSASDWDLRDGSGGCVRKRGGHVCLNGEGFVKVARAKVPNTWTARVNKSIVGLKGCEVECLRNCTCNGYASADISHGDDGGGCVMWFGDLIDTRVFPSGGQDFYVRVDAVELEQYLKSQQSHGKKGKVAAIAASVTAALLLTFCLFCWLVVKKRKETREEQNLLFSPYNTMSLETSSMGKHFDGSGTNAELPYFDLSIIVSATDNFSLANKLGEGGFGTVYKGRLPNGQEIAVKRLAKNSGQGVEEFKTEVTLIAKLQHRNLVRIFGGDQIEANTNRVVGTYGYMSPEYAMEGLFSIKSDVFSFGVLLLEIISGRKNSSYYKDNSVNLIGHVWSLWNEGRAEELVDSTMSESYSDKEVLRCIHIGLLCVQESANDRPNMSDVAFMLCNETVLTPPKQPAFIFKGADSRPDTSSSASLGAVSVNDVTMSAIRGR